jgi:3-hydroxyisobutyrate dehydrogenase-like beta-hydroxyacid dehydrogenase
MSGIGILYPGELGAALGRAIVQAGGTAVTCLADRSKATQSRATAANFVVVQSLEELARKCDLVISLVPPASAVEAARCFAACFDSARCGRNPTAGLTFVDANSVSPLTKRRIAEILSHGGICCLDGAFFGPASRIGRDSVLALSGARAGQIPPLLAGAVEVHVVGEAIGQASTLKMVLAIMTKALPALFLEMACASASGGQLDPALKLMRRLYPGIMDFLERTLPTYPAHVARRVQELGEVADWLRQLGQCAIMTQGAITILERLRIAGLDSRADWTFEDLLHRMADADLLPAI